VLVSGAWPDCKPDLADESPLKPKPEAEADPPAKRDPEEAGVAMPLSRKSEEAEAAASPNRGLEELAEPPKRELEDPEAAVL